MVADPLQKIQFHAMASPCEIMVCSNDKQLPEQLNQAKLETLRIEKTYSRYQSNNIIAHINQGKKIIADTELTHLLNFAHTCFELSHGLFDITSGVLRRIWSFNNQEIIPPNTQDIQSCLTCVGWEKVYWSPPEFQLQPCMEIDLGGIGKEYAVDKIAQQLLQQGYDHFLINFGGDIYAHAPTHSMTTPWRVGIEQPDTDQNVLAALELTRGGLATSGDSHRHLILNNKKYGHILNPKTGWPVEGAPRSISVLAENCTQAGFLATLGMLQGKHAENFFTEQHIQAWCIR